MTKAQFRNNTLILIVNGVSFTIERSEDGFRAIGNNYVTVFHKDVSLEFVVNKLKETVTF